MLHFDGVYVQEFGYCHTCMQVFRRATNPICQLHGDLLPARWQDVMASPRFLSLGERSEIHQQYGVTLCVSNLTVEEFWMCDTCGRIYRAVDHPSCQAHPDHTNLDDPDADILQVIESGLATPEEVTFLQGWINDQFAQGEGTLLGFPVVYTDFNLPDDPLILGGPLL